MSSAALRGTRVAVLGAGLAGLVAARDLEADGAKAIVLEARDRVGGRVHTVRSGFVGGQHAEAGADLIDGGQAEIRDLARELGLTTVRILRRGWGFYGATAGGHPRAGVGADVFDEAARLLAGEIDDYRLAGLRWDSAVASAIGRRSVAEWLDAIDASPGFRARIRGLRGFFLADPEDLSLLALVDQFAAAGPPGAEDFFRVQGGNDLLAERLAARLKTKVRLRYIVTRVVRSAAGVVVTCEHRGRRHELKADFCVSALPATTLRKVVFEPALPVLQRRAIATLRYGPATRMLIQFDRRFWRRATRPSAFGSDQATGAVWDGNENQRGRAGILSLLAGGGAAAALREIAAAGGVEEVTRRLAWLGTPATILGSTLVSWDRDPWAGGGYAVFGPSFDPSLRPWLARPAGRVLFAGEHTSLRWQGYMNGAIESGRRAAAEVRALTSIARAGRASG
jgi:monoamine oxidase